MRESKAEMAKSLVALQESVAHETRVAALYQRLGLNHEAGVVSELAERHRREWRDLWRAWRAAS